MGGGDDGHVCNDNPANTPLRLHVVPVHPLPVPGARPAGPSVQEETEAQPGGVTSGPLANRRASLSPKPAFPTGSAAGPTPKCKWG